MQRGGGNRGGTETISFMVVLYICFTYMQQRYDQFDQIDGVECCMLNVDIWWGDFAYSKERRISGAIRD